jgi:hypothetical protein
LQLKWQDECRNFIHTKIYKSNLVKKAAQFLNLVFQTGQIVKPPRKIKKEKPVFPQKYGLHPIRWTPKLFFFFVKVVLFSLFINSFWVRLVFCRVADSLHWICPFYAHSLNLTCFYGSTFTKESWLIADHQNLILVRYLKYLKFYTHSIIRISTL